MAREKDFFRIYSNYIFQSIRTFMPARIIKYDKSSMTADVQPLFLMKQDEGLNPVKMGMLQKVPVINNRFECEEEIYDGSIPTGHSDKKVTKVYTPIYKEGDVVMLAICDRNIDNLSNVPFLPNSSKMFSVNDAVVIGGWRLK